MSFSAIDSCGHAPTDLHGTGFLDLADATVITFLTPSIVATFSTIFQNKPFTGKERIASLLAMLGVVFIARPTMLFRTSSAATADVPSVSPTLVDGDPMAQPSPIGEDQTADSRLMGIMLALLSAVGGAGAFISIRAIGSRAHTLTTTSYFSALCTVFSATALLIAPLIGYGQPQLGFGLPQDQTQWLLILAITICGMLTQLLMTAGIGGETKTNKAPAMVYTGMIWTAGFDRWVFGKEMYWSSIVGCALIVGGAAWIAIQPKPEATQGIPSDVENCAGTGREEAAALHLEMDSLTSADSMSEGSEESSGQSPLRAPA